MTLQEPKGAGLSTSQLVNYLSSGDRRSDAAASRLSAHMSSIRSLLGRLEKLVVPEHLDAVTALISELDQFRVQVSLVGQVKAGKTMLTNSLIGMPGLLPSDVNPWTSAVTSVHINTPKPPNCNAVFTFYTQEEWANLTESGGRLGELAQRAEFENELAEMRSQVAQMKQRTEDRLGANFGLLLGAQHRFSGLSTRIIERYVSLGEVGSNGGGSGRYADITKSAELYKNDSSLGFAATISDTPGVNDPFLARERTTLNTVSRSDICVVVLTAHQSFSTVDLALLRILLAVRPEQVILFVNRIDELEDPDRQIAEIDEFIRKILREKGISPRLPIIFGSAAWAEFMQLGPAGVTPDNGLRSLAALAASRSERAANASDGGPALPGTPPYSIDKTTDLSGLHELKSLISDKAIWDVAAPFTAEVLLNADDLAQQSILLMEQVLGGDLTIQPGLRIDPLVDHLDTALRDLDESCFRVAAAIADKMLMTMSNAFREFIDTESNRIREIAKKGGRISDWSPDSEGLRKSLNAAYHSFVADSCQHVSGVYAEAARMINSIYTGVLHKNSKLFSVRAPRLVEPKTPALLMRTMTIDMKTTFIGNWLARATGAAGYVTRFRETVSAEMLDFLAEMRNVHVKEFIDQFRGVLHDFLSDHLKTLEGLAMLDGGAQGSVALPKLGVEIEVTQRMVALKGLNSELQAQIAAICADFDLAIE
jgi:Dynamin family